MSQAEEDRSSHKGMALGISFGLITGAIVVIVLGQSRLIAVGAGIGMCVGLVVGMIVDSNKPDASDDESA